MAHPPRILIVEDDVSTRRPLESLFARAEYDVLGVATAQEALDAAAHFKPNLAICDLNLPDLDGVSLIRRLRESEPLPIIMLTASDRVADAVAALKAGALDYLVKPCDPQTLLQTATSALTLSPTEATAGRRLMGHYRLLVEIGRGGMGTVYRAHDTVLEREVAVKVLHRHLAKDLDYESRFLEEARATARLSHPNIIQLYDAGRHEQDLFLVMEFLQGRTLGELLREQMRLPVDAALDIVRQAASALGHAHQAGLVHRDVKPGNIMIDHSRRIKIMDFGLAHRTRDSEGGPLFGTLAYAAPEHLSGRTVDARADIYSLGIVFFQILSGTVPYDTLSPLAYLRGITEGKPPKDLQTLVPNLSGDLSRTIQRMTAVNPDERFSTCTELLEALGACARV